MVCVTVNSEEEKINKYCCGDCRRAYERKRWAWTSEITKRRWYLKKKYGLSVEDYQTLFDKQDGKCACCSTRLNIVKSNNGHDTACVDHNHKTGKVRGLLCNHCNRALGLLKEDAEVMKKLISYLETHDE